MTTANSVYIDMFNSKLDEFIKELVHSFPEVKPFAFIKTAITMLKNVNPKRPIEIFHKYVHDVYKEFIINKDEQFFLNANYDMSQTTAVEYWQEFIDNIRDIWFTLDDAEKEAIWRYFHILLVLDEKMYA
jgi:hypothetical protein